jgi:chromosome segregation ATPase
LGKPLDFQSQLKQLQCESGIIKGKVSDMADAIRNIETTLTRLSDRLDHKMVEAKMEIEKNSLRLKHSLTTALLEARKEIQKQLSNIRNEMQGHVGDVQAGLEATKGEMKTQYEALRKEQEASQNKFYLKCAYGLIGLSALMVESRRILPYKGKNAG